MKGRIHSLESFGTVDGPGVRYVVFFQGCPMRCAYCHNPDTWSTKGGTEMEASYIIEQYERNKGFYANGGGLTVTGGEPLLQYDFSLDCLKKAKSLGIHTAIETCGYSLRPLKEIASYVDLWLYDIKLLNDKEHFKYTGVSNEVILKNLAELDALSASITLHAPIIPNINQKAEHFKGLIDLVRRYPRIKAVQLLPYHPFGLHKAEQLGTQMSYQRQETLAVAALEEERDRIQKELSVPVEIL